MAYVNRGHFYTNLTSSYILMSGDVRIFPLQKKKLPLALVNYWCASGLIKSSKSDIQKAFWGKVASWGSGFSSSQENLFFLGSLPKLLIAKFKFVKLCRYFPVCPNICIMIANGANGAKSKWLDCCVAGFWICVVNRAAASHDQMLCIRRGGSK